MNREETKAAGETMLHYANGGEVQWRNRDKSEWNDYRGDVAPFWDWDMFTYRIKPQPVVHERWVITYGGASWTCLTLDDARNLADRLTNTLCYKGDLTLTHLTGEEQPWQK